MTPWTVTHQAPLSMEFSRQEYWSAFPFPSPGDLLHPGIEPGSPTLQADSLQTETPEKPCWVGVGGSAAESLQSHLTLRDPIGGSPPGSTFPHLPWESPGKNAGVGCHFLLQFMKVKSESEVAQSCPTQ